MVKTLIRTHDKVMSIIKTIFEDLYLLGLRVFMGCYFWYAGQSKINTWDQTLFLFKHEYALPYVPHEIAAYAATGLEIGGAVCLFLGLFTKFASLAFLLMVTVIELFIYPDVMEHYFLMFVLGVMLLYGGGKLSLDRFFTYIFKGK